jgi:hypothetical protein
LRGRRPRPHYFDRGGRKSRSRSGGGSGDGRAQRELSP